MWPVGWGVERGRQENGSATRQETRGVDEETAIKIDNRQVSDRFNFEDRH